MAKRNWILDENGRWNLNPAVNQITPNVKMCLRNMEKFDDGWESLGLETVRQFYYYIDETNGCDERLFRIHEDTFNVPDQDLDKITNVLGQLGLNEVPQDFAKVLQDYRKLLGPSKSSAREQTIYRFPKSSAKQDVPVRHGARFNSSKLNTQLCYLTLKYFHRELKSCECCKETQALDVVWQMPGNRLSNLPAELRLQILENQSLAAMDQVVRSSFQDLVHLYLPNLQRKAKQWYMDLISRNNFVYAGVSYAGPGDDLGDGSPCDIYRLKYPNLHPDLQARKYHPNDQHPMDPNLDPEIVVVQHPPSLSHAGLLLMDALEQTLWHRVQPKSYIRCRDKIWRTNIRPRPLAFFMEPPTYEEHQEFEEPDFTIDDRYPLCRDPQLIIYQDELNLILDELEPFLRPAFLKRQIQADLDLSALDLDFAYIFPSPVLEENVFDKPTSSSYQYGYIHLKQGARFCQGIWDVNTTGGTDQSSYADEQWRSWYHLDQTMQQAEVKIEIPNGEETEEVI